VLDRVEQLRPQWVHAMHGGTLGAELLPRFAKALRQQAERIRVPMPLASLLHDLFVAVEARGWSELDWSALGRLAAFEAGFPDS
jgi:3-hydroxyisobutyrate dehydrogenase-like beta-hydroxyacid dehydrogenase